MLRLRAPGFAPLCAPCAPVPGLLRALRGRLPASGMRPVLRRLLAVALVAAPIPAAAASAAEALRIAWDRDLYNPQAEVDDVLVPVPCGGAMVFRWVAADGTVPAGSSAATRALYGLRGPFAYRAPGEGTGQPALLVGKYEVTALQHAALQAASGGSCPAVDAAGRRVQGRVAWQDAVQAAAGWSVWLAERAAGVPDCASALVLCVPRVADGDRVMARLPTEAEWEYAARGGVKVTPEQFAAPLYPMPEGLRGHAWFADNADGRVRPIGYRAANPLGLHDVYGNVEELQLGLNRDRRYPGQVGAAVIRGGSVHSGAEDLRAGRRSEVPLYGPGGVIRAPDNGYRLLLDRAPGAVGPIALASGLAAPGAARTQPGHLQVNVDVAAEVRLDGRAVGRAVPGAPLALRGLAPGEHALEVSAQGYGRVRESPTVGAARWTQVAVALPAARGLWGWWADLSLASERAGLPSWLPSGVGLLVLTGVTLLWRRVVARVGAGGGEGTAPPVVRATEPEVAERRAPTVLKAAALEQPTLIPPTHAFEPEMIALPGGEFWMGSPEDESGRRSDEGPRHRVRIEPFGIGKTQVTFGQYDAFCEATGRVKPEDRGWDRGERPVINVSWHDAMAYAQWLSKETERSYRLPTEAEWEYAARAGTQTPFWTGRDIHTDQANYDAAYDYNDWGRRIGVYRGKTVVVGSLPANPWGLHEVLGNVWEWTSSEYAERYAGAEQRCAESKGAAGRVLRGGSWYHEPGLLRAAARIWYPPVIRNAYSGFRLARTLGGFREDLVPVTPVEGGKTDRIDEPAGAPDVTADPAPREDLIDTPRPPTLHASAPTQAEPRVSEITAPTLFCPSMPSSPR
ncbi:SUMF1/EgtB/PvdO family nonheme iron enzyme [Thiocapsa marina]|uniref:Sulphatase-modifying factor protein n=1 Tax=Thiocapsa marina 5811 TaxID=768671 RepID=F9UHP3_9GAMM|nr:SUMF1/EgtB/PvdO family nonheme iron enzyme [Thiocapsa marina]EGV16219.1 Sulphatase-modifying factor protein [Thiocapsa marina 5811]